MNAAPRLSMHGIRKSFGGVAVLDGVDFSAERGEVVALLGANGAGKSTLMKVLTGLYTREAGRIAIDGEPVAFAAPAEAIAAGIRLLPQEISVLPDMSVAENIFLPELPMRRRFGMRMVDDAVMAERARALLDQLGFAAITPETPMKRLSVAEQRIVEIARALAGEARVLVMDEPTAALTEQEARLIFRIIRRLTAQGVSVVYISHYLREVFEIADRIVVLRDGRNAGSFVTASSSQGDILSAMLGGAMGDLYEAGPAGPRGADVLAVEHLSVPGALDDVGFAVASGEIFGVFGLVGSGVEMLGRALYGGTGAVRDARIMLAGQSYRPRSPRAGMQAGIGFVAAERKRQGIIGELTVRENICLPFQDRYERGPFVSRAAETVTGATLDRRTRYPCQRAGTELAHALRREPAKSLHRALAGGGRAAADHGGADARRGCGRAPRNLSPDARAGWTRLRRAGAVLGCRGGGGNQRPRTGTRSRPGGTPLRRPGQSGGADGGHHERSGIRGMTLAAQLSLASGPRRRTASLLGRSWAGVVLLLAFYVALLIVFSVLSPYFLNLRNMLSIGGNVAFIGLMAATGTPLIIAGGLDLSVAAVAGLVGVLVALLHASGLHVWLAALAATAIAAIAGFINGWLTMRVRLNPLIATLGTMSVISGIALVLTGGLTRPLMVPGFNWVGGGRIASVPVPLLLMLATFVALWVMLTRTRFGRYVYASGGNPEAARLIGVPVERVVIALYVLSALSGAVAGIVLAAMLGAAAPNAAGQHLLTVIAAIILGGTSLYGGRGSVWGTVIAVLILGTLANGLTLLDVSSFWQDVTRGVVLILAVSLDQLRTRAVGD